jgi:heat shock protein HslJ
MKRHVILTLFLIIFSIAGAAAQSSSAGGEWKLTYLRDISVGDAVVSISIDKDGRHFTGNTSCNLLKGTVDLAREAIKFSPTVTTRSLCTISTAKVESGVLSDLRRVDQYKNTNNKLQLFAGKTLLMEFETIANPAVDDTQRPVADQLNLEDKKWVLESIGENPLPKVQEEAFVNFDAEKKSAGGNTSCNAFGGDYETNGDEIAFSQMISTMRACIEDKRMDIERDFLDGLRNANRYQVSGDKLLLYHDQKLLLTFVGRKKTK